MNLLVHKTDVNDSLRNLTDLFLKFISLSDPVTAVNSSLEGKIIGE